MEREYTFEKQFIGRFLSMKLSEFQMDDNKSIINQVYEFLVLVSRLKDLKVGVSKQLQVTVLIAKLLATWNDYRKKLQHTTNDFIID